MNTPGENRAIALSQRFYKRLLRLYPRAHREEYGDAMAQLFRDQCRDAWQSHRGWGLVWLWLRILPELFKTAAYERLANRGERKRMFRRTFVELRDRPASLGLFIAVSVTVFIIAVMTTIIVTFMQPEIYASKARIKVEQDVISAPNAANAPSLTGVYDPYFIQTEMEVIQSERILDPVIKRLDLNSVWAKKYGIQLLTTAESRALLKHKIEIRPARNTSLIDITVYSDDRQEAADIANAIARTYVDYRRKQREELVQLAAERDHADYKKLKDELKAELADKTGDSNEVDAKITETITRAARVYSAMNVEPKGTAVEIIEHAEPGFQPVRPNKPLDIFIGICLGMVLGLAAGMLVAMFAIAMRKQPAPAQ